MDCKQVNWKQEQALNYARHLVKNTGYMSAFNLATQTTQYVCERGFIKEVSVLELLNDVTSEAEGIYSIEYTNTSVEKHRLSNLYYYNPTK